MQIKGTTSHSYQRKAGGYLDVANTTKRLSGQQGRMEGRRRIRALIKTPPSGKVNGIEAFDGTSVVCATREERVSEKHGRKKAQERRRETPGRGN